MALADLTTTTAVKAYANINYTTDDTAIAALVTAYSAWVRSYVNRDITTNTYDIRRSGRGTLAMQMPQYPITAITLLEVDGQAIPSQLSWGAPGYRFDDEQIVLEGYCFTRGTSNVHVQFTAGYATTPADITQAVNELVALRYKMRDKLEFTAKGLAGETVTFMTKDMPAAVATVLNSYMLVAPL